MRTEKLSLSPKVQFQTIIIRNFFILDSQVGFACDLNIVTLYCADNKTINISSAYYGVNAEACSTDCCAATAADCTEDVETAAPIDWQILLLACQNQTFCQFENPGRSLGSCQPSYSDYVVIGYSCYPGKAASDTITG